MKTKDTHIVVTQNSHLEGQEKILNNAACLLLSTTIEQNNKQLSILRYHAKITLCKTWVSVKSFYFPLST